MINGLIRLQKDTHDHIVGKPGFFFSLVESKVWVSFHLVLDCWPVRHVILYGHFISETFMPLPTFSFLEEPFEPQTQEAKDDAYTCFF